MFVSIYHPDSGGTAEVDERTVPGWRRAGWTGWTRWLPRSPPPGAGQSRSYVT